MLFLVMQFGHLYQNIKNVHPSDPGIQSQQCILEKFKIQKSQSSMQENDIVLLATKVENWKQFQFTVYGTG